MTFLDITQDIHFIRLYSLLGQPYRFHRWRQHNVHVPLWTLTTTVEKAISAAQQGGPANDVLAAFLELLTTVVAADQRLQYTTEDMDWLMTTCQERGALLVVTLLMAYATAVAEYYTPVEIAAATGTHESGWRNKAAAGDLPGAFKKGKQWVIPGALLRAEGIRMPDRTDESEENEE